MCQTRKRIEKMQEILKKVKEYQAKEEKDEKQNIYKNLI